MRRVTGEARATIARIRTTSTAIAEAPLRSRALALCETAELIVNELQHNPGNIAQTRQFLHYYLEAVERILTRYARLGAQGRPSADVQKTLARTGPALDELSEVFSQQLERLRSDGALDLDAELTVLEKTVALDGSLPRPASPKGRPS